MGRKAGDTAGEAIVNRKARREYEVLETLEAGTTLVNCGTWGWLGGCDPAEADVWHELFTSDDHITPRHHLTYARIDYDEQDVPHAQLLDFSEGQGGM